ncbi:MAG: hypothetical protein IJ499_01340 [Clostridia bacterium]|nr:hypothetical protein [Clostridia bacterium]
MKKDKKKKEKIVYIDDGRTIADMSGLPQRRSLLSNGSHATFRERWNTYWAAVRMMLVPMFVVIGALAILYIIMAVLFWFV